MVRSSDSRRIERSAARLARIGISLTLLILAVVPSPAAAQEAVRLRLNSETGESLTYRFELSLDIAVPTELGGAQRLESLMVVQQTTRDIRGDTLFFDSRVHDASLRLRSEGGDDLIPNLSRELAGQSFRTAVTRQGEPLEIQIEGQSLDESRQLQSALRQAGFPTLPERPVEVGDRWSDTVRIRAADIGMAAPGYLVLINDISLQRLSRSGPSTVADILVQTIYEFEPDDSALPGVSVEMIGSRADNVRFDVTRGHFLSARGAQDFTMNMTVPGLGQAFSVQGTGQSSASLVES